MSAPVAAEVLRELSAPLRTFGSVRAALLWYMSNRPDARSANLEPGRGDTSPESKDTKLRTIGVIASCLVVYDPDNDLDDPPRPDLLRFREAHWRERLESVMRWNVQNSAQKGEPFLMKGVQMLADELGLTPAEASRYCGQTESILRRRMVARGLIGKKQSVARCECGCGREQTT